ncbi:MAG: ParA family protein [Lachnospiraceae bacterium]|nr:ParA family protein [Lachnospiraceae bacterium]
MRDLHTVFSITNQKGGVGKTTTALNLGAALAASGKRVLLVDNDPQGNLTAALGFTQAEQKYTLANLLLTAIDYPEDLEFHLNRTVLHTETGPDLIPANRRLADAAARLQVMQLSQYNAVGDAERSCEKMLDSLLAPLKAGYDYIVIDCGLKHELLTVNALAASNYCIIPVQAHYLASEGIPEVLELVRSVQMKFNPTLKIAGILLTMYQSRPQLCRSVRESVGDIYGEAFHVFEQPIEYSIKVAECPAAGQSIFDYSPKNAAALSYRSLAEEVLELG